MHMDLRTLWLEVDRGVVKRVHLLRSEIVRCNNCLKLFIIKGKIMTINTTLLSPFT